MSRFLREPLLHFLMLGALMFGVFAWLDDGATRAPNEIVVDAGLVERLAAQFERTWQRPPMAEELAGLVENWVRDEVFFREGIALGLDRGDEVVRRRIAQKMRYLSESLATPDPTDADLRAWLDENPERYRFEPVYSFRQAWFDPQRHGGDEAARAAAAAALVGGEVGEAQAGGASLLADALEDASQSEVARIFGEAFAGSLAELPVGSWAGPVRSGFGYHLVRIDRAIPARDATLDEVRNAVERDWTVARQAETLDALYQELRGRYTIRRDEVSLLEPDARTESGGGERAP